MRRRVVLLLLVAAALLSLVTTAHATGPLSIVTTVAVGGVAHDVALASGFAYVATDRGLTVLDLANPAAPVARGSVAVGGCQNVEVRGTRAYLACVTLLAVVDVADPDAPRLLGRHSIPHAWDVAVTGTTAYVSSMAGELYVIDAATPALMKRLKTIGLPAWKSPGPDAQLLQKLNAGVTAGNAKATGVSIAGNRLFTVDWGYGRLYVYDITTPAAPVFAGTHYAPYILKAVGDPANDVVYMLSAYSRTSGIYTVPLSMLTRSSATYHAGCAECRWLRNGRPNLGLDQGGLALAPGNLRLFYGGGRDVGEFHVIDVSNAPDMVDLATLPIGVHQVTLPQIMNGEARGDLIYFAAGALGVHVFKFPGL